ncbi:cytochrome c oxidase assembly protein [Ornithinibacillus salinisoli]|uniref:Cytochrome c oxidase assembly protein n=1 Tax=Ornithinibacillus salinisoli TaxID=1848459 RepID=A0ABW4VTK4_9BACI
MLDIILEEFHFTSLWNGGIFLFLSFVAIIYLFLLPHDHRHSIWKSISFLCGLGLLFLAIGSPMNIIGRIAFSTHIMQVVLLLFVVPPLLLVGLKQKAVDQFLAINIVKVLLRVVTKPFLIIGLFYMLLYIYHIPAIFDQARVDLFWNYFYLFGLFIASLFLWVPIISPNRMRSKQKIVYIVLNILFIIPYCFSLWLINDSLYLVYTDMTSIISSMELCLPPGETLTPDYIQLLLPFDPIMEQKQGGGILFGLHFLIFISAMTYQIIRKGKNNL